MNRDPGLFFFHSNLRSVGGKLLSNINCIESRMPERKQFCTQIHFFTSAEERCSYNRYSSASLRK